MKATQTGHAGILLAHVTTIVDWSCAASDRLEHAWRGKLFLDVESVGRKRRKATHTA